jgi:hypothetical protein
MANWRIRDAETPGAWVNLRVTRFDEEQQLEVAEFGLQGRSYTGVSTGRTPGMRAKMEVLVRTSGDDTTIMTLLLSGLLLDLEDSLGRSWQVRVVSKIDRDLNAAPTTGTYNIKHEFFLGFKVVESA